MEPLRSTTLRSSAARRRRCRRSTGSRIDHLHRHGRVPMLLLVGQNDPRCPSRSVDVYVERLKRLGKPYEEYRYDAGHGSLVVDESLKQLAMEIDFVAKHLGTPPRSSAGRGYRIASSSGFHIALETCRSPRAALSLSDGMRCRSHPRTSAGRPRSTRPIGIGSRS